MKPPEARLEIEVSAVLKPTESFNNLAAAIKKILPKALPMQRNDTVSARSANAEDLSRIYEQIRSRQTIGVVRARLRRNLVRDETSLLLNKQAAFAGAVVICDDESESPLGAMKFTLRSEQIGTIIDWLAPDLGRER